VDTIVLGCTHYSFLTQQIKNLVGDSIKLIDTSSAIAEQLQRVLTQENLQNNESGSIQYFTTGSIARMEAVINNLLGENVSICKL